MKLTIAPEAKDQLNNLPIQIQKKAHRQFTFLLENYRHPSLRTRKMGGSNTYEARIDIHYRFSFQVEGENIYILIIGPHDVGLGKR